MNTILEFMEEDHDRLDKIMDEFRKAKNADLHKAKQLFHDFKIGLQKHIVWEEEILFPTFENKTGINDDGPTAVMRIEHRQIKEFLEKIHHCLIEKEINKIDELGDGLLGILKPHNDKEESILYPWIDRETNELERKEMFARMKNLSPEKYNKCCE